MSVPGALPQEKSLPLQWVPRLSLRLLRPWGPGPFSTAGSRQLPSSACPAQPRACSHLARARQPHEGSPRWLPSRTPSSGALTIVGSPASGEGAPLTGLQPPSWQVPLVLHWGPCVGCVGPCAGLQALTEQVGRVCRAVPALAGEGAREPPESGRRGREPPSGGWWWHHQMEPSHLLGGEKTSTG